MSNWITEIRGKSEDLVLTRYIYLRLLGVMLLCAFLSVFLQKNALIGTGGITPIAETLSQVGGEGSSSFSKFFQAPSLFWLSGSDGFTSMICLLGLLLSIGVILNFAPRICLALNWLFYLSVANGGQVFFTETVDFILLEAVFLSIFFAPKHIRPTHPINETTPSVAMVWLLRLFIFKIFFCSGLSKIYGIDFNWRDMSLMENYYLTMPLPSWVSWYIHQFRPGFHGFCEWGMYFIELIIPFYIFAPRKLRLSILPLLLIQQVLIAATGNFGLISYLKLTLCLLILDDQFFSFIKAKLFKGVPTKAAPETSSVATLAISIALFTLSLNTIIPAFFNKAPLIPPINSLAESFHISHSYFKPIQKQTERKEIIIEGSINGKDWKTYEFRYKPSSVHLEMPILTYHLPRLDWKLHEAAKLESAEQSPWLNTLIQRLIEGDENVAELFIYNPFTEEQPKFIRAQLYQYSYVDILMKEIHDKQSIDQPDVERNFVWWKRKPIKVFAEVKI